MASIWSAEKQGAGAQDEKELADMTVKKLVISVPENEMMMEVDDVEDCKTPTRAGSMIPSIPECPPAPKKKRLPPLPPIPASDKRFFDKVWPEEIEFFFQFMNNEAARANNGSKSV